MLIIINIIKYLLISRTYVFLEFTIHDAVLCDGIINTYFLFSTGRSKSIEINLRCLNKHHLSNRHKLMI